MVRRRGRRDSHPSQAAVFALDEANERELAGHGIAGWEAKEVFDNRPAWSANKRHRAGDWKMIGVTNGGRRLTIVVRYDGESRTIRPITGWHPTEGELSRYF
jgi:hypothetical protein